MKTFYPLRFVALLSLVAVCALDVASAQPSTYNDSPNDIDAGISTGGGTLDILAMEVTDTVDDVIFTLTVGGNIVSTDWGNFMIGIATLKTAGTTTGNGWARPINLNAGEIEGTTYGMTHWIGSWVNGVGGAQLWSYGGTSWTETGPVKTFSTTPGAQSQIIYTVTKASLGVATGDTIFFDAYSSGGGAGDTSIDALSNPNVAVTAWNQPYTSQAPTISSYTLSDSALAVTTDITFSVDMNAQIAIGTFNPAAGDTVSADWGDGFLDFVNLTDDNLDGVYEGTASVSAAEGTPVAYRYTIVPFDFNLPLISESVSRSFAMPSTPLALPVVFFNNAPAYRNVTFTVDMSVQESLGTFDPVTQTVEVRGPFNNWIGTAMSADGGGLYSATLLIGGENTSSVEYKYFATGSLGYESIAGNRTFTLEINEGGNPDPAQVLAPTFFSNQTAFREVTFSVDMSAQQALGLFDPDTATVELRSGSFGPGDARTLVREGSTLVYSLTFGLPGAEGEPFAYKFYSAGINYYVETDPANPGYEIVNQADLFENRQITLDAAGSSQTVPQAYFSNQLFGLNGTSTNPLPDSSLLPFSTTQGTASAAQSLSLSGVGLTANIVATAPAGFEVSADGSTYDATAAYVPVDGAVTSAPLYIRLAGSASVGSPTGYVALTSTGSQTTNVRVTGTVNPGAGYDAWATGYGLDPTADGAPTADPDGDNFSNQQEYAFGTIPTEGNAALLTTETSGPNLIVRWLQRSDISYTAQSTANLATTPFADDPSVVMVDGPVEPAPPAGYTRKEFSVPATGTNFYRVQGTTTP